MLFAQRMIRMLDMYFSIVRRSAAWASRESESASLMMTTVHGSKAKMISQIIMHMLKYELTTFETLFRIEVYLLRLSDFLEEFLDDHSIIVTSVAMDDQAETIIDFLACIPGMTDDPTLA